MKHPGIRWVVSGVGAFLICQAAHGSGAIWYVAPGGDDGHAGTSWATAVATIARGVTLAGTDDTVLVSNGVYTVTAAVVIDKAVTVKGLTGLRDSIVDGNYPNTTNRCFYLNHTGALVAGLTIRNGASDDPTYGGGGVYVHYTPGGGTISNCTITGSRATLYGGGVFIGSYYTSATLTDCTISNNTANQGGGVRCHYGPGVSPHGLALVRNCIIAGNTATYGGGGLSFYYGGMATNCTIAGNKARDNAGGGVGTEGNATYLNTLVQCRILGNAATNASVGYGGGMVSFGGCAVRQCLVSNNTCATLGGGIHFDLWGSGRTVENSIVTRNSAGTGGGGIYTAGASLTRNCLVSGNEVRSGGAGGGVGVAGAAVVENCTIVRNQCATGIAGGVIGGSAQVRITNCIAYFNSAGGGGNNFWDYSSSGFTNTYSHCCLTPAPAISAATNITANPLFMDGGSGYGISFVSGDFHLQKGSPCVNAGANAGWMATGKDLDNKPRLDPDGVADIGAYEFIPVVGTLTFIK